LALGQGGFEIWDIGIRKAVEAGEPIGLYGTKNGGRVIVKKTALLISGGQVLNLHSYILLT
tara:strand:- start:617 stop:799 length:183 start_codon:yes stop_codon:yes gene_type:complete